MKINGCHPNNVNIELETIIFNIISKLIFVIKSYGTKIYNKALLTNNNWIQVSDTLANKYIFKSNGNLLISADGVVEKSTWEQLDSLSLIIENGNESNLYNIEYIDSNIFILKTGAKKLNLVNEKQFEKFNTQSKIEDYFGNRQLIKEKNIESRINRKQEINKNLDLAGNFSKKLLIIIGIILAIMTLVLVIVGK
ncbi:hypothetical protein [Pedobacter frigiditerrae]|uniref:hypothetical protein n=1 Tax=Pedobacter frigiditerrae TaxID=2530452 RepID=UPI00292DBBEF|nr:hypothetical protein [Pedobacter frigiditerrae]